MKLIKALLFRILPSETYLTLVSKVYIALMNAGFFKKQYAELHYIQKVVKSGDVVLDLGANMGYYSYFMSKAVGASGEVHAVEPVQMFAKIFNKNTSNCGNVTLYNVALGSEAGKLKMGTPKVNGVFRHGLTKVVSDEEAKTMEQVYEVEVKVPDVLFKGLKQLNFVKCDVEGFEVYLFPNLIQTLERFKPVIQIEISTEVNRKAIFELLQPLGYHIFHLKNDQLIGLDTEQAIRFTDGDFYLKVA